LHEYISFLDSYKKTINSYDEVINKSGEVKPYYDYFAALEAVGMEELGCRNNHNKLKENGVTYNVYDSENELVRPWKLDLFLCNSSI
jgi:uncharacterized circularly permuted ATP-grasp superfamily protein